MFSLDVLKWKFTQFRLKCFNVKEMEERMKYGKEERKWKGKISTGRRRAREAQGEEKREEKWR